MCLQIISETLHVQDVYNFVIYRLAWGYYLLFRYGLPEPQSGDTLIASTPFLCAYEGTLIYKMPTDMPNNCYCFLKHDLKQATEKLTFLEENFTALDDGLIDRLPEKDLVCCICLINIILLSVEKGEYTCPISEVTRLLHKRDEIIRFLS